MARPRKYDEAIRQSVVFPKWLHDALKARADNVSALVVDACAKEVLLPNEYLEWKKREVLDELERVRRADEQLTARLNRLNERQQASGEASMTKGEARKALLEAYVARGRNERAFEGYLTGPAGHRLLSRAGFLALDECLAWCRSESR
jgi:regulator of protease activity HflC (stomatin/prohibitin superfamily)